MRETMATREEIIEEMTERFKKLPGKGSRN
jgi:hypothetical protein